MKNKLILIRGIPGSGKSTIAKDRFLSYEHFEADMWMYDKNGNYSFSVLKLKSCHLMCEICTKNALKAKKNVVVSNTFIKKIEMEPYLQIAKDLNVEVEIITAKGRFKNSHGVPDHKVIQMLINFEE